MTYATGIGSRRTPPWALKMLEEVARALAAAGWTWRSGAAPGADSAIERGAGDRIELYLPWRGFEGRCGRRVVLMLPTEGAYALAAEHHPVWATLSSAAQALLARNGHQVLGANLKTPSRFVLCWTPGGRDEGGTAQALRIARSHGIPIYNIARGLDLAMVQKWISSPPEEGARPCPDCGKISS